MEWKHQRKWKHWDDKTQEEDKNKKTKTKNKKQKTKHTTQ